MKKRQKHLNITKLKKAQYYFFAWCCFLSLLFIHVPFVLGDVVIHQVLYDPLGTEAGGEAIELYNNGDHYVDISGWVIRSESSSSDATIPAGEVLLPFSYYLIADEDWDASKDDPAWPSADYVERLNLYNTDSGIALLDNESNIIDAIGWGDPLGIAPELYEGVPHPGVDEGESLIRLESRGVVDTNNNSFDFVVGMPSFGPTPSLRGQLGIVLQVVRDVFGGGPGSSFVSLNVTDDDPLLEGYQVSPLPGRNASLHLSALVNMTEEPSVYISFDDGNYTSNITRDSSYWRIENTLPLSNTLFSGEYTLIMNLTSNETSYLEYINFTYLPLLALALDTSEIVLENVSAGSTQVVFGDDNFSSQERVTLRNVGNVPIRIGVNGTTLIGTAGELSSSIIEYSLDRNFTSPLAGVLSSNLAVLEGTLSSGESLGVSLSITVPASTPEGVYYGTTTFLASS